MTLLKDGPSGVSTEGQIEGHGCLWKGTILEERRQGGEESGAFRLRGSWGPRGTLSTSNTVQRALVSVGSF